MAAEYKCPECGGQNFMRHPRRVDVTKATIKDSVAGLPEHGDITVCSRCFCVLKYAEEGWRSLTDEEWLNMPAEERAACKKIQDASRSIYDKKEKASSKSRDPSNPKEKMRLVHMNIATLAAQAMIQDDDFKEPKSVVISCLAAMAECTVNWENEDERIKFLTASIAIACVAEGGFTREGALAEVAKMVETARTEAEQVGVKVIEL